MKPTEKRFLKVILYSVLSITLLIVTINIAAGWYVNKLLRKTLAENTSIPYNITFSRASVNILTRSFHLNDISVVSKEVSDSAQYNSIDARIASINISGISYVNLLLKKILRVGTIEVREPVIHITDFDHLPSEEDSTKIVNLYTLIKDQVHSVNIEKFGIRKAALTISSRDTTDLLLSVAEWNVEVDNIHADSTLMLSEKMLEAGALKASLNGITGHFQKALYAFRVNKVELSSNDEVLTIDSITLKPTVSKEKFGAAVGYQTDCLTLHIANFKIHSTKFSELMEEAAMVYFEKVEVGSMNLYDYRDKNIARAAGIKPMPVEMLKSLPFSLTIDSVLLGNAEISYEELLEGAKETGTISFSKVSGKVTGITNVNMDDTMKVSGFGYMLNQAAVGSQLQFPLNGNKFYASVNMEGFDMRILNSMIKNFAPIEIVEGHAKSIQMWCAADENKGSGQMTFTYSDLQVGALSKDEKKEKSLLTGIKNFVANEVILEKDNPKGEVLRVGKVDYSRNPERNIINYSWNLILSGFKSSIGLKEEKLKKAI